MNRTKNRPPLTILPMAIWTLVFVAIPLIYVLGLSFMKKAAPGHPPEKDFRQ